MKWTAAVLLNLILCLASFARADAWIEPGESFELRPNEGLAAFVIDSDAEVERVDLDRIGSIFSIPKLPALSKGRHLRLLKLPAGEYVFNKLWVSIYHFDLSDIPNASFSIEPGKLNYVGDLVARGHWYQREFRIVNAGIGARDLVDREYKGLTEKYPWNYVGRYPDPFIAFLEEAKAKHKSVPPVNEPQLPEPSIDARDWAERLFRDIEPKVVLLDLTGRFVFESKKSGNDYELTILDLDNLHRRTLYRGVDAIDDLMFLDTDLLGVNFIDSAGNRYSAGIRFQDPANPEKIDYFASGYLISTVPGKPGVGIFASTKDRFRLVEIDLRRSFTEKELAKLPVHHPKVKDANFWWIDRHAYPRLAYLQDDDKEHFNFRLYDASGAEPVEFSVDVRTNETFSIVGFDNRDRLLALTNYDREHTELVQVDPRTGVIGETVLSRSGVDLLSVAMNPDHSLRSISYRERGNIHRELLASDDADLKDSLSKALPGRVVHASLPARNGRRIVFAYGSSEPGRYYLFEKETRQLRPLASLAPHLEGRRLAESEVFSVKNKAGQDIEAILTRNPATRPQPLIVIPHGGPFGVFDRRIFDPEVQFFAALDFAVLQVNYRGGAGLGKDALKQGYRELGRGIEDDIEIAVDEALKRPSVDPRRVVVLGTSYGGFSALSLAIRHPGRYRAAVGIAGAYDIALQFTGSDAAGSEKTLELMAEMFGDPIKDKGLLQSVSPVYAYERINSPLLLVHDRGDVRVPFEHARRLQTLLTLRGKPASMIALNDGRHGISDAKSAIANYPIIAAFLDKALSQADPK